MLDNILDGDDGVRAVGDDASGRDRHRLAGSERTLGRPARRDVRDDRQASGQVARPHRVSVHRRARERRQVDGGARILRGDASGRRSESDAFGREDARVLQHPRLRLVHGE